MSLSSEKYSLFILDSEDGIIPCQGSGVFRLKHGQEYKVKICNHNLTSRIDAEIMIDGKKIGVFRVNANSSITVERPADDEKARKLTFFDFRSTEARRAGLVDNFMLGRIDVNISVETSALDTPYVTWEADGDECDGVDGLGGTGLGAASSQKFRTCRPIEVQRCKVHLNGRMLLSNDNTPVVPL